MKKIYSLTIILLTTTAIISCSDDMQKSPDKVYRQTTDNPALGANAGVSGITPPIADSISTSLDLFSGKREKLRTPGSDQQSSGTITADVEEKVVPKITIEGDEQPQQALEAANNVEIKTASAESQAVMRAPRLSAEKTEVAENAPKQSDVVMNKQEAAPAEAKTEEIAQAPVEAGQPAPVTTAENTQPVEDMKVTRLDQDSGKPFVPVTKSAPSKAQPLANTEMITADMAPQAPVVEQVEQKEIAVAEAAPEHKAMPASMYYKSRRENGATILSRKLEPNENSEIAPAAVSNVNNIAPLQTLDSTSELPPVDSVNVGQCYGKTTIFGEYKEVEDNILVKEAAHKTIDVPAEYKEVEEDVVIKEASTKLVNIPAKYQTVEEEVVVTPERTEEVVTSPAKYNTVTEQVLVQPAQKTWKDQGGIMKLVEVPAQYRNESKKVLVEDERRDTRTVPAVTKKVKKQVLVEEARVEKQEVPAVTRKIKKEVLVSDAQTKTLDMPAQYRTEKKKVAVTPDKKEWMPVLCKDGISRDTIKRLQGALIAKGYDLKIADGVIGKTTEQAINQYQESLGFSSDGVALKTLDSLGIQQ